MKERRNFYNKNKKENRERRHRDQRNRMRLSLCAAVGFLTVLVFFYSMDSEAAAEELGGFQVEMGTGENTSLPSDWENEPADDREEHVQTEEPGTDEFPSQWEGEALSDTQMGASNNNPLWQEQGEETAVYIEDPQRVQNQKEESSSAGEAFGDGSRKPGNTVSGKSEPEQKPEPDAEEEQTDVPKVSFTPAVQKTPSPALLVTPPIKESQIQEISQEEAKDQKFPSNIPTQFPCIFCWKENVYFDTSLYLKIIAEGEIKILSVKINGKESPWNWREDGIEINREAKDALTHKNLVEIALLAYGNGTRGIFIDGKNKPCYTIQ